MRLYRCNDWFLLTAWQPLLLSKEEKKNSREEKTAEEKEIKQNNLKSIHTTYGTEISF